MNDQAKPAPRPPRRFLRFSVRGMIVLVLMIGGGLGWLVRRTHSQRDAVAAIRAASGSVQYEWEWKTGKAIDAGSPPMPKSLIELLTCALKAQMSATAADELKQALPSPFNG
jgi:hypothetical protein